MTFYKGFGELSVFIKYVPSSFRFHFSLSKELRLTGKKNRIGSHCRVINFKAGCSALSTFTIFSKIILTIRVINLSIELNKQTVYNRGKHIEFNMCLSRFDAGQLWFKLVFVSLSG